VAVVSRGVRSGSTLPFVFASDETARRIARLPRGSASFWVLDLERPSCAASVAGTLAALPGLDAAPREALVESTRRYWLATTGVGASLGFVALMGLVVGGVVVGQTLFTMVRDHERELATLRALGARRLELAGFVAWQAALLGAGGVALGVLLSAGLRQLARGTKLTIVLPPSTALLGTAALALMCLLASALAARRAMTIDPAEVFA
jgi:putative ABC transport system permease protein